MSNRYMYMIESLLILTMGIIVFDTGVACLVTQIIGIDFKWIYIVIVTIFNIIFKFIFGYHLLGIFLNRLIDLTYRL